MMKVAQLLCIVVFAVLGSGVASADSGRQAKYLYGWAGDADKEDSDFVVVIDADPASANYGQVVATTPVGVKGTVPHHTEYETPPGSTLFANGWKTSHSFVLDISEPTKPRVAADFKRAGGYSFPHSFARLPSGNVLATFQATGEKYAPPGALVELDDTGRVVRASSSATPDIPTPINWPYSLAVAPKINRVVTTSTDMGMGPNWKSPETSHVQIWRLSNLKLLSSVRLPDSKKGKHHTYPAEPRVLADGSVYVNTFTCGLYRLERLTSRKPTARFVHAFPSGPADHDQCAVPLVYGKYWIQSVGAINGVVVLDVRNPNRPVEVSRLSLPHSFHAPHWMAADRVNGRIAVTGMHDSWLALLKFDERTGRISIDKRFGVRGGVQFDRPDWPHGASGKAIVHGVVFSR